jgi:Icc protein
MPIHLRPLSRRKFLARTLVGGAGLAAFGGRLFAATKPFDPHFWALFSDIHLAADRSLIARGINMSDHFQTASIELLAMEKRPAGFFVCGDCAFNSGETADYAVVRDLLAPIRVGQIPVHLALGNHDNRERFWEALNGEKSDSRPFPSRQTALIKSSRVNWFILDSLEKTLSTPGLIGEEQLAWLAAALDKERHKPAIVMVHHNPGMMENIGGLKDTEQFRAILQPRKQVKACIYGHTHAWHVEQDSTGLHWINLPPIAYVFREGDPSGWVSARMEEKSMRLEFHALDRTHRAHGEIYDLEWRRA